MAARIGIAQLFIIGRAQKGQRRNQGSGADAGDKGEPGAVAALGPATKSTCTKRTTCCAT